MTAILLDFGGVLVLPNAEPVRSALSELQDEVADEALERAFYGGISAIDRSGPLTSEIEPVETYVEGFLTTLGLSSSSIALGPSVAAAFLGVDLPWSTVVHSSVEAMRELQRGGHLLAVVSNSDGRVKVRLREFDIAQIGHGAGATVGAIIDSHVVGIRKPDARIFRMALAEIGASPADAVHVGDSLVYDVKGAEAADLRAIHFDPWAMCSDRNHEHIRTLAELLPIV